MIEIILAIFIIGVLVVFAIPLFLNISTQARQASRDGVSGAVRSGIILYRTNDLVTNGPPGDYPPALDSAAANTPCGSGNLCFSDVLIEGVRDGYWSKGGNSQTYVYNDGTDTFTYTYNSTDGTFTSPGLP